MQESHVFIQAYLINNFKASGSQCLIFLFIYITILVCIKITVTTNQYILSQNRINTIYQ